MQTQLTSAFDFRVLVLECERCGAPAAGVAGTTTCQHCGATLHLGGRETLVADSLAAGPLRYLPDPDRDAWLRTAIQPGHVSLYDVRTNVPPDLAPFARGGTVQKWQEWIEPELRRHWTALTIQARSGPLDADAQYRLYWLAVRLANGLAFLAGDTTGQPAEDLRLRQRAVLETALNLLADTGYVYVLRCDLSVGAALQGDASAAKAWLTGLDPYPSSADIDGRYRLAVASIFRLEQEDRGLLTLFGPLGSEIPVAGEAEQLRADCYRIHAYERLGETAAWSRAFAQARARHGAGRLRGVFETLLIAPHANQKLSGIAMRPFLILFGVAFAVPTVIAIVIAALALFMHFVLGYD